MKYTALYREWRPETFDDIVGQDTIVRTLKNQIKSGRIGHAYLFSGPRGTGKTSTAKIFAKAVNCTQGPDANPCGECNVCIRSAAGNTMDIIEIDAASNNGVDEIRDLRDKAKFPPALGRYKVYIIDEVHMLSSGAFNALLKTLEEPPPHIIFILATTEPHKLPATIISRCQRYDFKLILLNDIVGQLSRVAHGTGIEIEDEALYTIARWSEGGMRDALSLLDQCIGFCGNSVSNDDVLAILGTANEDFMFEMVNSILDGDSINALKSVNRLIEDGRDISVFVRDITTHMRNLLIVKTCSDNASALIDASPATFSSYQEQAESAGEMRIFRAVEMFVDLEAELKWASQPRVLLELTIARLCRPEDERNHEALIDRLETLESQLESINAGNIVQVPINTAPKLGDIDDRDRPSDRDGVDEIVEPQGGDYVEAPQNIDMPGTDAQDTDMEVAAQGSQDTNLEMGDKEIQTPRDLPSKSIAPEQDIDISSMWPQILKMIKKERVAIYTLIMEAKLEHTGDNVITLVFPQDQGFFVTAVEKEDNRGFIEEMVLKSTGREFRLNCVLEGENKGFSMGEDPLVEKAIDIFGKDNIEIVDDM